MKVLIIHRYYWPDSPPYGLMLRSLAERLVSEGHEVDVFTAQPSYGGTHLHDKQPRHETVKEVQVYRAPLLAEQKHQMGRRGLNLGFFAGQVALRILRRDYDIVLAATTPPILVGLSAYLAGRVRNASMLYHMQDVHPEVMLANSGSEPDLKSKLLTRVDSITSAGACRTVVLSEDMKRTLAARGQQTDRVSIINNFLPDSFAEASTESSEIELAGDAAKTRVIFAGNLGRFQGLTHAIEAMHELGPTSPLELVFVGDGLAKDDLVERAGDLRGDTVHFMDRVSAAEAETLISQADLGLVSLNPGIIGTSYPSKTLTYLGLGTPVVACVESDSELASIIASEGLGWACPPADSGALANMLRTAAAELPGSRDDHRARTVEFAKQYAAAETRLDQWVALIGSVQSERASRRN